MGYAQRLREASMTNAKIYVTWKDTKEVAIFDAYKWLPNSQGRSLTIEEDAIKEGESRSLYIIPYESIQFYRVVKVT